jgi:catechol 2,3-dioxygenase-like lactoylglutathione lyase family enzyme
MKPRIAFVAVGVSNLERSRAYYEKVLAVLRIEVTHADANAVVFGGRFTIYETSQPTENAEIGFRADSRDAVAKFHRVGLGAGFRELEPPTMHGDRFSTALEDPDANIIEAVHRGTGA